MKSQSPVRTPPTFGPVAWGQRPALTRVRQVVTLGLAAAFATGLTHALTLAIGHFGFGRIVWVPRGYFWMSPIAYGLVFAPGIVFLSLLALATRKKGVLNLAIFAYAAVAVFGLLLPLTQISRTAALVLAAGIASQLSFAMGKKPDRWIAWSERLLVAAVLILPVSALWTSRSLAAPGENAAQPAAPNVLVVVMDAVRTRNALSPEVTTTPALKQRAREGVVFNHAFSTAPWTLPSHASMFTGLYPTQQDGDWTTSVQRDERTLAELYRDRGYATGAFVANLHYTAWDSGLLQGFEVIDDYRIDWLQVVRSSSYTQTALFTALLDARSPRDVLQAFARPNLSIVRQHTYLVKPTDEVATSFLEWQRQVTPQPFFAFLNLMDAHMPYFEPDPIRRRYPPAQPRDERAYDAAIAFIDAQLDHLLDSLEQRGALDNTVVVITSDHGELFDQHGLSGHANSLYLDVLHVPMMIRYPPRVPGGRVVDVPVSQRDLAATLLDLTDSNDSLPGASLRAAWEGRTGSLSPVLSEIKRRPSTLAEIADNHGDMRSLFSDSLHYIVNEATGMEELFAWRADPAEAFNLLPDDANLRDAWRARLEQVRAAVQPPRISARR